MASATRRHLDAQRAARAARAARRHAHGAAFRPQDDDVVREVMALLQRGADRETTARALARLLGVSVDAARLALTIADHGGTRKRRGGTTTSRPRSRLDQGRAQGVEEVAYRAAYVAAAARRLDRFDPPEDGLAREARFWQQHVRAREARMEAANDQAVAAAEEGPWLGWYTHQDDRTTPECLAANGTNYRATKPPKIGRPGTLHGGTCRCRSGPPWPTARTVDQATRHLLRSTR